MESANPGKIDSPIPATDDDYVVNVDGVSKFFEIYRKPSHRLYQMVCRGRHRFYEPFWALRDISFKVKKGESLGIVGRNGAGKSTLLQIIADTLSPSQGTVSIKGRIAALLELGSGFNPDFTGRENVFLNAAILGLTSQEIEAKYDDIAAFADIGNFIDQPVKTYSSGMTVRLAFSVLAHVNADLLIIDEALAVGDAFFTQKCMRFMRGFMEEKTVIFVSHDINSVVSLCNRAILLKNGRMIMDTQPKDVAKVYLKELYAENQDNVDGESESDNDLDKSKAFNETTEDFQDMRLDLFNCSNLRNDLEIFKFDKDSEKFGDGRAHIENVWLSDSKGNPLNWVVGGEICCVHVTCACDEMIFHPIVGFLVRDNNGLGLFGDNTFIAMRDRDLTFGRGEALTVSFRFRMPIMPPGDYFISIALASGTQKEHVQHEWLHEAIHFTSHSSSASTGLLGIPMLDIEADVTRGNA